MRPTHHAWPFALRNWLIATLSGCVAALPCVALADQVHLAGGAVIEGKAVRQGDKVIVTLATGTVSLEARSVVRIVASTTTFERLEARRAALSPDDVRERLALADGYRAEGAPAVERELLHEILTIDPNHEQARARLGYVRGEHGWVDGEQRLLAQGYVKRDGRWLSPAQQAEQQREAQARTANALAAQRADAELQMRRAELETRRIELQRMQRDAQSPVVTPWIVGGSGYAAPARGFGPWQPPALAPARSDAPAFPINGVRDPRSYFP